MSLWLRFQCLWNGICYRHGTYKCTDRGMKYCPECDHEYRERRQNLRDSLIRKVIIKNKGLGCPVPPSGWFCLREPGHEGPCAAVPNERA